MKKRHYCFWNTPFYCPFGYQGLNRRRKSPLIAPIGRQNAGGLDRWHGQEERTPVFGIDHPGPGPHVTCTPPTTLLRRRPPLHERVMVSIIVQIRGIPAHPFWKTPHCAPFGGIRHKMGSEMNAKDAFGMADRLPDGLKLVESERKGCFWGSEDEFSRRIST